MKIHPACDLFPELPVDQLEALAKDIKEHGLLVPIITINDEILDGRNRFKACGIAGVEPTFKDADGVDAFKKAMCDPYAFVVAMNLHRRHLSESERAMIAAKIANLKEGRPKTGSIDPVSKSTAAAAQLLNVSTASVKRARVVQEKGVPALVKAVESGKVAVSTAAQVATLPPEQQTRIVNAGGDEIKKAVQEVRTTKEVKKKPVSRGCYNDWRKLCDLSDSIKRCADEMEPLHVDDQHRIPARALCEALAERFNKLALKLVEK